ncbi:MAG: hypothetical protein PHT54_01365 [Candidatus Nanoarchaeia archaeon]|nr:hypothetical protein [Candidatus Nanoarchaeia archaeon]
MEIKLRNGETKILESLNLKETEDVLEYYSSKVANLLIGGVVDAFFAAMVFGITFLHMSYSTPNTLNFGLSIVGILLLSFFVVRGTLKLTKASMIFPTPKVIKEQIVQLGGGQLNKNKQKS